MSKTIEQATDMEVAIYWASEIDNPCGVEVDSKWLTLRGHYIKQAQEIIPILTNPFAIEYLENKINEYS